MEGRSVITNLLTFVDHVSATLAVNTQVDAIYTDYQKAFDKVSHFILLKKMAVMDFSRSLLKFFRLYLQSRC